jgi:hypothetical protein
MTRVSDLKSPNEFLYLNKIARREIKLCWHDDYLHGPITGMLKYQNRKYWFHMCDENTQTIGELLWHRRYLIIELTNEQIEEEEYWHKLFREKVGTHTDYDEQGYMNKGEIFSQESQAEFYQAYQQRVEPDFSTNILIGWFEL